MCRQLIRSISVSKSCTKCQYRIVLDNYSTISGIFPVIDGQKVRQLTSIHKIRRSFLYFYLETISITESKYKCGCVGAAGSGGWLMSARRACKLAATTPARCVCGRHPGQSVVVMDVPTERTRRLPSDGKSGPRRWRRPLRGAFCKGSIFQRLERD